MSEKDIHKMVTHEKNAKRWMTQVDDDWMTQALSGGVWGAAHQGNEKKKKNQPPPSPGTCSQDKKDVANIERYECESALERCVARMKTSVCGEGTCIWSVVLWVGVEVARPWFCRSVVSLIASTWFVHTSSEGVCRC